MQLGEPQARECLRRMEFEMGLVVRALNGASALFCGPVFLRRDGQPRPRDLGSL